ncbi:MAG TPA: hypothetical protein VN937_02955 [Blastocatellia bacterium]|nr:hypothetical protein [Blastocatellia bacterium]
MDQTKLLSDSTSAQEEAIAPGCVIERRFFIRAASIATAALAFASPGRGFARVSEMTNVTPSLDPPLDFESFIRECSELAKTAQAEVSLNEEAHIFRLSAVASRLRLTSVPNGKLGPFSGLNPPVEFGPLKIAAPLAIIQWRLAPGATLPAHNHNPADVISLCLEGACTVRHFDIVDRAPDYSSKESFLIRESRNDLLTPGRMSSLSTVRDNIHTFHAGKAGAMGIDINSILPGEKPFSFLDIAEKPRDPQNRIYDAVWKKL